MNAGLIILILKILVSAVTVLLAASLLALWSGRQRLHGRINLVFFILTATTLIGLEVIAHFVNPEMFERHFTQHHAWTALKVHLCFSMPAAALLPIMLFSGLSHRRRLHLGLAGFFLALWIGTFITGVFFLPTQALPG